MNQSEKFIAQCLEYFYLLSATVTSKKMSNFQPMAINSEPGGPVKHNYADLSNLWLFLH